MESKKVKIYISGNVGMEYFFFLEKTLGKLGYSVVSIYSVSEVKYRSLSKSNKFEKIKLRGYMYLLYPIKLIFVVLRSKKESIFIITSNTFFTPYLISFLFSWKKIKVIHLLYDLFPDAIEIAGMIKTDSFISKIVGQITKKNLSKCNSTVFLGEFLKSHAEFRWGVPNKAHVIDISTDLSLYKSVYVPAPNTPKIIIHYGGQLGYLHSPSDLIESVKYINQSDIASFVEFNFYVSGANSKMLTDSLNEYPVKIISAVPSSEWRKDILNFHIGLVSLSPGGATVCLPSKTYGMMAGGLAILAIAPIWSDLSNLISTNKCGWVINNSIFSDQREFNSGSYLSEVKQCRGSENIANDFYLLLKDILINRDQLEAKRINSYNLVRAKYNIESVGKKWRDVINQV